MSQKSGINFEIKQHRVFSEPFKKALIKRLISKQTTIRSIVQEHQVSASVVYRWLYKYSPHHQPKCTLVVQMDSEKSKNSALQQRIAELERIIGQKQLEVDFLNKLLEIGSKELGFDLKKSFSSTPSSGTDGINTQDRSA